MGTITTGVIYGEKISGSSVQYAVIVNYKGESFQVQSCLYSSKTESLSRGKIVEVECNDDKVDWTTRWNREVKILDGSIISLSEARGERTLMIFIFLCFILLFIYCAL